MSSIAVILISLKADMNQVVTLEDGPLILAVRTSIVPMIELLCSSRADIDHASAGGTALHYAVRFHTWPLVVICTFSAHERKSKVKYNII